MPPRYAYWTILIDNGPTAFRAAAREDLLPTLHQLQRKNANVVLKWFERGRLWESPEEAREARRTPKPVEKRDRDWRPGGLHRDPRARWKGGTGRTGGAGRGAGGGMGWTGGPGGRGTPGGQRGPGGHGEPGGVSGFRPKGGPRERGRQPFRRGPGEGGGRRGWGGPTGKRGPGGRGGPGGKGGPGSPQGR